jgi:N-glycosylase/DNA lyase
VDTHVYQIAIKHYGFRGSSASKSKINMTPKLYEEVNAKLAAIWGEYAGWAHSVCGLYPLLNVLNLNYCTKVLFTADLRIFASYGLPSPSPLVKSGIDSLAEVNTEDKLLPTIPITDVKRRRAKLRMKVQEPHAGDDITEETIAAEAVWDDNESLVERVKKRKRIAVRKTDAR